MKREDLYASNLAPLQTYCKLIIELLHKSKCPKDYHQSVMNHVLRKCIRYATDSVSRFPGSGKDNALYISEAAQAQRATGDHKGLVCDHVIPVGVLTSEISRIWEIESWRDAELMDFLLEYAITAVITADEDGRLVDQGLRRKMPNGQTTLTPDIDKFARYKVCKISCVERTVEG